MTDETPVDEDEEPPTDDTTEDEEMTEEPLEPRSPYVRYSTMMRRGSMWNSPLGLAAAALLISKGMDLAYRAFIEREKTQRMQIQQQNPK